MLFDELNFCLQRLYSIPFHVDMPFNDSILEEITTAEVRTPFSLNSFQRNLNLKGFPSSPEPGALCQLIIVIGKRISVKSNCLRIYKKRKHCANCLVVFSLDPFLQKGSSLQVENLFVCLSVCLSVCHHFKISNIDPLYHPRITPDPTYHILLGRG